MTTTMDVCAVGKIFSTDQVFMRLCVNLPLAIIGLVTNALNIVIFSHRGLRSRRVGLFLVALSASDLCLCAANIGFLQLPVLAEISGYPCLADLYPFVFRYTYPLGMTAQMSTIYLTLLACIQRYVATASSRLNTQHNVSTIILITLALSTVYVLPRWHSFRVTECVHASDGSIGHQLQYDRGSLMYQLVYEVILYTLLMFLFPFVALTTVNVLVIRAIRVNAQSGQQSAKVGVQVCRKVSAAASVSSQAISQDAEIGATLANLTSTRRRQISAGQRAHRDRNISRMMVTIGTIFLMCHSIPFATNIIELVLKLTSNVVPDRQLWFRLLVELGNVSVSLNSASTILVYLKFSARYRHMFDKLIFGVEADLRNGAASGGGGSHSSGSQATTAVGGRTTTSSRVGGIGTHGAAYRSVTTRTGSLRAIGGAAKDMAATRRISSHVDRVSGGGSRQSSSRRLSPGPPSAHCGWSTQICMPNGAVNAHDQVRRDLSWTGSAVSGRLPDSLVFSESVDLL